MRTSVIVDDPLPYIADTPRGPLYIHDPRDKDPELTMIVRELIEEMQGKPVDEALRPGEIAELKYTLSDGTSMHEFYMAEDWFGYMHILRVNRDEIVLEGEVEL